MEAANEYKYEDNNCKELCEYEESYGFDRAYSIN
jgi:hypothetical protein